MWDYNKLFAKGNIVGVKNCYENRIYNNIIDINTGAAWVVGFKNDELCCKNQFINMDNNVEHSYTTDFEIQYIIRLDEHGNVVEKLFDRERDMKPEPEPMPKLENGMFGKTGTFYLDYCEDKVEDIDIEEFVITENKVLFIQEGKIRSWGEIEDLIDSTKSNQNAIYDEDIETPIEIYKNVKYLIDDSDIFEVIWRHPEYQKYLDSKTTSIRKAT